jgi:hypothetical protein
LPVTHRTSNHLEAYAAARVLAKCACGSMVLTIICLRFSALRA